ncbi:MAG TPA: AAA family ATPase [Burkholderiales bacterium]|nr:AAA family ATPase [Burkholderiales bacterium]
MALYLEHFGLREPPFRITPHTDFFFDGADRGATLEALLYAIQHEEGIVKVVGEVGSGKTLLCRVLIERLPKHVETIYLANPSFSRDEILFAVAEELKIDFSRERATIALRALQDRLIASYAEGRRTVILIDEAHAMPEETLEQVRLLSNLETSRHKLLQIVLFGQPELDEVLALPNLRQLKDRITHSFRMRPLSQEEAAHYVSFRMRAAGYRGPDVFAPEAVSRIARASGGLTRRINILADKALLAAFSEGAHAVKAREARAAIADSEFAPPWRARRPVAAYAAIGAAGLALGLGSAWYFLSGEPAAPSPVRPVPALQGPAPSAPTTPAPPPVAAAPAAPAAIPAQATAAPATRSGPSHAGGASAAAAAAAPSPLLQREQIVRLAGYNAGRNPLLMTRLEATRERLESEPDTRYTLELYITENSDPARVERFLMRAQELVVLDEVFVVPLESGGRYRIWALYGVYPDRSAAREAAQLLPPKYQQAFRPYPRSFAELRRTL